MAVVSCPVSTLRGVPVITAPREIDMASAETLRAVLAESRRPRARHDRGRSVRYPVL